MHRFHIFWALPLLIFTLVGCQQMQSLSDSEANIYAELHKKFSRMESYSATVRLTVKSNKTENIYTMTQKVKSPDQAVVTLKEPTSLAGVTTVFSGDFVFLSPNDESKSVEFPARETFNHLFLNEFFSMYYQSEDTALSVNSMAENQSTILLETAFIPDTGKQYKVTLLCDAKKLEPKVMTVYDMGGNVQSVAEFSDFSYNPPFSESLFKLS